MTNSPLTTDSVSRSIWRLDGAGAIVTGAGSGIGRATAVMLAERGARIAALDLDDDAARRTVDVVEDRGGTAVAIHVDLADEASVVSAIKEAVSALGPIEILVNAAGIAGESTEAEWTVETWDRVNAVNVRGPMLTIRELVPHLRQQRSGGRIVNVSSSSAFRARNTPPAYGASKAALTALTRSVAATLGPSGVTVNTVAPGVTRTPMLTTKFDTSTIDGWVQDGPLANLLERVAEPEDVAAAITFLCLPAGRQITGQVIHTSAGAVV